MLIFDNATGVGRRIGDVIHETELFSRFRAHYHFRVRFCNPYSGWEKKMWNAMRIITRQTSLCLFRIFQMLSSIIISCF